MEIKILGICGSPIKGGNTEVFLGEALKVAREMDGVSTEMISLAGKKIEDCRHCNWCITKQGEGMICATKDDMQEIYPKILQADALLIATPTYFTRLSGYTATFMDRFRAILMGKHYHGSLTNKVVGALTVLWWRNFGAETALLSIVSALMAANMIVVGSGEGVCQFGAVGMSSEGGTGKFDREDKLGVLKDERGIKSAHTLARRVVEVTRMLKAGKEALNGA
jgi:multimeric flavodoxin WrbA